MNVVFFLNSLTRHMHTKQTYEKNIGWEKGIAVLVIELGLKS